MKPTLDRETLEHIQTLFECSEEHEWPHEFDHRYRQSYIECASCSKKYWDNGSTPDKNGKTPYQNPEDREHHEHCRLAASLKFMRAFLDVEEQLHREAEDEEAA